MSHYQYEFSQAQTSRPGARDHLLVSGALAKELERDFNDHKRRMRDLKSAEHTDLYRRGYGQGYDLPPRISKHHNRVMSSDYYPSDPLFAYMRELDSYKPPKPRRSTLYSGVPQEYKFLFKTRY